MSIPLPRKTAVRIVFDSLVQSHCLLVGGGCMVPHPFFWSGTHLSFIRHRLFHYPPCEEHVMLSESLRRPFLQEWLDPKFSSRRVYSFHIRNPIMRVQKRSSSLIANVTANINISSDLLMQIVAIVDLVLKLPSLAPVSSSSQPASGTSSSEIAALIGEITHSTLNLLSFTTVSSLVWALANHFSPF